MALLTFSNQQAIKPISDNNQRKYTQIQLDTERLYLPKLLGDAFAYELTTNPESYEDLLNGSEFTYCGYTIKHKGLLYVLAYYTYSEYVLQSNIEDSFTGMVQLNRNETSYISKGQLEQAKANAISIAQHEFELIKDYLNQNANIYPLWQGIKQQPFLQRSKTLRKTVL